MQSVEFSVRDLKAKKTKFELVGEVKGVDTPISDNIKIDLITSKLKVYIVIIHYNLMSFNVERVFFSRKQAEEYVKKNIYDKYSIIEHEVTLTGGKK